MDVTNAVVFIGSVVAAAAIGFITGVITGRSYMSKVFLDMAVKDWSEALVTLKQARRLKELYTDDDKQDDFK